MELKFLLLLCYFEHTLYRWAGKSSEHRWVFSARLQAKLRVCTSRYWYRNSVCLSVHLSVRHTL